MEKELFKKYVNLIRKRAHKYSQMYGVDYYELESQGFLIFCECLEKYDISKSASFCTYLYTQLNKLGDYVKTYKRQSGYLMQDYYRSDDCDADEDNYEVTLQAREYSPDVLEFLKEAKESLSEAAYDLIEWIIGRTWECKNKKTPTISMAVKYFRSPKQAIEKLWEECGNFWNSKGFALYV